MRNELRSKQIALIVPQPDEIGKENRHLVEISRTLSSVMKVPQKTCREFILTTITY